jgi:glycosylphosphatidylinositol transamidase (GPIT) subunit GPI8
MHKKEIEQYIMKGYIQAKIIFEIVGSPKKHVDDTIKAYLQSIKQDKEVIFLKEDIAATMDAGEGMYSTYAEVEVLIKGIQRFTWICFNFMPANIEIIRPKELVIKDKKFTDWVNDLLAKLHEVNTSQVAMQNQFSNMLNNINAIVRNIILLALEKNSLTAVDIAKKVGTKTKDIEPVLKAMIEEKKIKKKGKKYSKL